MSKLASKVVEQALAWLGRKEGSAGHKEIVDIYNNHKPRARGYKVKYTDAWCATFVSAVAVKLGYTDIIPTECSCPKLIEKFKKLGIWIENENRTPNLGDIIFYDWQDNGKGDNLGAADHVGIVVKVENGNMHVAEGNYDGSDADRIDGVEIRVIPVNARYIRGYGVPKYDAPPAAPKIDKNGVDYATSHSEDYNNKVYTVTASALNMRAGAGTSKKVRRVLKKGERLECYGYYTKLGADVWLLVKDKYGKTGFVNKNYVK
jgi:hypothetical protein